MSWLEFIKVRTVETQKRSYYIKLLNILTAHRASPDLLLANLYTRASIPGDFCIAMIWDRDPPDPWGSDLGLGLVQELKRSGLVDHGLWIEMAE